VRRDVLEENLSNADIVFISSLMFPLEFLAKLGAKLDESLKKSAVVFTSKEILMSRGKLADDRVRVGMSWNPMHSLYKYVIE